MMLPLTISFSITVLPVSKSPKSSSSSAPSPSTAVEVGKLSKAELKSSGNEFKFELVTAPEEPKLSEPKSVKLDSKLTEVEWTVGLKSSSFEKVFKFELIVLGLDGESVSAE